jgi:hypothetical protein
MDYIVTKVKHPTWNKYVGYEYVKDGKVETYWSETNLFLSEGDKLNIVFYDLYTQYHDVYYKLYSEFHVGLWNIIDSVINDKTVNLYDNWLKKDIEPFIITIGDLIKKDYQAVIDCMFYILNKHTQHVFQLLYKTSDNFSTLSKKIKPIVDVIAKNNLQSNYSVYKLDELFIEFGYKDGLTADKLHYNNIKEMKQHESDCNISYVYNLSDTDVIIRYNNSNKKLESLQNKTIKCWRCKGQITDKNRDYNEWCKECGRYIIPDKIKYDEFEDKTALEKAVITNYRNKFGEDPYFISHQ